MKRSVSGLAGAIALVAALATPAPAAAGRWQEECTSSSCTRPSQRMLAAMAHDKVSGSVLLFGGRGGDGQLGDTWSWNGIGWTKHNPTTSPPASFSNSMAYDPVSQRIVLFTTGGQTWLWKGGTKTWSKQSPPVSPSPRLYSSLAYDPASRTVLLFGGFSGSTLADTWAWNGATKTWTRHFPSPRPPARMGASMATDPTANNVVLFGGNLGDGSSAGDTWTWDGISKQWTLHSAGITPQARSDAAMARDDRGNVLLVGGRNSATGSHEETWTWNGGTKTWSPSIAAGPSPRSGAAMAYDAARRNTLLFGGYGLNELPGGPELDDTWTYVTLA